MYSGVQRLLDARGQRGSWMPSKIFCIHDDPFLVVHLNEAKSFTFFASVVKFHENSLLGFPPVLHHAPVTTFFNFIFGHLPTFLKRKLASWMPPRVDARGRRTVRTPSARHWLCKSLYPTKWTKIFIRCEYC